MREFDVRDIFLKSIESEFEFLKQEASFSGAVAKSIILPKSLGVLLPINYAHSQDDYLISLLARWREENYFAYPTRFEVTFDGTRKWLNEQVLDNPSRLLFLVVDQQGKWIGHVGLANCLNDDRFIMLDNIVRGDREHSPGIMSEAVLELTEWVRRAFMPGKIYLKVLDTNSHAINFYERLGFVENHRIPLKRQERKDGYSYIESTSSAIDCYFIEMVFPENAGYIPKETILTAGPFISSREASYANDAVHFGWNKQWNKYLSSFEEKFADYVGVKHAIATSSGTGALHIALLSLGIGPGDEVIVPDLTWVATGQVVNYVGAIPIFADVQRESWCLDPLSFKKMISKRTKAVIPVHLYGHPAKMDEIMEIARDNKLFVIEDAAPSIGAEFEGKRTGSFGDFAMFSFQGAKLVVTGEGGILLTDNDKLYERAHKIWDQGRRPGTFWIDEVGWKYKMSNIQAALGLGQLDHVDQLVIAKRKIFEWYQEFLEGCDKITLFKEAAWAKSIYWMTSILLNPGVKLTRDDFINELKKKKIDTRPVFPAISQYVFWPKKQKPQKNAFDIGNCGINLPSGVCLRREEVKYVSEVIKNILSK